MNMEIFLSPELASGKIGPLWSVCTSWWLWRSHTVPLRPTPFCRWWFFLKGPGTSCSWCSLCKCYMWTLANPAWSSGQSQAVAWPPGVCGLPVACGLEPLSVPAPSPTSPCLPSPLGQHLLSPRWPSPGHVWAELWGVSESHVSVGLLGAQCPFPPSQSQQGHPSRLSSPNSWRASSDWHEPRGPPPALAPHSRLHLCSRGPLISWLHTFPQVPGEPPGVGGADWWCSYRPRPSAPGEPRYLLV